MQCKKCGKEMSNGARFCISCGAEHDSNGELVSNKKKIDYNKTMMADDLSINKKSIDYNKTMMANDLSINRKSIDYNKTMMANDISYNKSSDKNNFNKSVVIKKKKKTSIIVFVICIPIILFSAIFALKATMNKENSDSANVIEQIDVNNAISTPNNIVSDYKAPSGYWSKDTEYYYIDGEMQKNMWVGEHYVGSDGKKVKNKLIDDTYYVDADGKKVTNEWYKFKKKIAGVELDIWYYLGDDGAKLRDTFSPDGYYLDPDGIYTPGEHDNLPDSKKYVPE